MMPQDNFDLFDLSDAEVRELLAQTSLEEAIDQGWDDADPWLLDPDFDL